MRLLKILLMSTFLIGSFECQAKPKSLKIQILAGQSNMEGKSMVETMMELRRQFHRYKKQAKVVDPGFIKAA